MFWRSYPKTMASVLLKTTEHDLEGLIALGWLGVSVREISPPMVGPEDAGAGVDNFAEHVDRFGMRMVSFSFRLPPSVDSDSHVFQSVFFHEQGLEHMPLFWHLFVRVRFHQKTRYVDGEIGLEQACLLFEEVEKYAQEGGYVVDLTGARGLLTTIQARYFAFVPTTKYLDLAVYGGRLKRQAIDEHGIFVRPGNKREIKAQAFGVRGTFLASLKAGNIDLRFDGVITGNHKKRLMLWEQLEQEIRQAIDNASVYPRHISLKGP